MVSIVLSASLVAYSVVVSQPLAYLFFLAKVQRELSGPAYVELRQRINPVMGKRLPGVYMVALVTLVLLLVLAAGNDRLVAATSLAIICLMADVVVMLRASVPINGVVDGWSSGQPPDDWENYRTKWFAAFAPRQVLLLVGFVALVFGAAFR